MASTSPSLSPRKQRLVEAADDLDAHQRALLDQPPHRLRQQPAQPGRPRADADAAGNALAQALDLAERIAHLHPHGARVPRKADAEWRQLHPARQAPEELHAEILLKQPDALGQRRLGDAQLEGGGREAPPLGDLEEVVELAQVDHAATSDAIAARILAFAALRRRDRSSSAPGTSSHAGRRSAPPRRARPRPPASRAAGPGATSGQVLSSVAKAR